MTDLWPKYLPRAGDYEDDWRLPGPMPRHVTEGLLERLDWQQRVIAGQCESPIEERMADALYSAFRDLLQSNPKLVELQAEVGPYRADFKVGKVIVECDGKEFHETHAQLQHDGKRDRWMIRRGYSVIRFSGAQIHRSPLECAAKVRALFNRVTGVIGG